VSNYDQRTFDLVVSKNHDHSRQLTLRTGPVRRAPTLLQVARTGRWYERKPLMADGSAPTPNDSRCRGWSRRSCVAPGQETAILASTQEVMNLHVPNSREHRRCSAVLRWIRVERRAARSRPSGIRRRVGRSYRG
jgi:hypothetical protein